MPKGHRWTEEPLTIEQLFEMQRDFGENFYDINTLTDTQRHDLSVKLTSALHAEVSSITSQIDFRTHRVLEEKIKIGNILHESVDVIRYTIALLNLWGLSSSDFDKAYQARDSYLTMMQAFNRKAWDGVTPVVIVDLDDVLTQFKPSFNKWLRDEYNITPPTTTYYSDSEIKFTGKSGTELLEEFVAAGNLDKLDAYRDVRDVLYKFHSAGDIWIHILTARDDKNLVKKYATLDWIKRHNIPCDRVDFASEKYLWLTRTEYFKKNKVIAVIDDSPKNIREFNDHGLTCIVPTRSYNVKQLEALSDNLFKYETSGYLFFTLERLIRNHRNDNRNSKE